jgi:spore coat protein U-like protein
MYTRFIKKLYALLTISASVVSGIQNVQASANANLQVTATVLTTCTIAPATLAFGSYTSGSSSNLTAQANIGVTCGIGLPYKVKFNDGQNESNAVGTSYAMKNGTSYLSYAVSNSNTPPLTASSRWPSAGVSGSGTGSLQNIVVYGIIPSGQIIPAGSYADTIVMTITF